MAIAVEKISTDGNKMQIAVNEHGKTLQKNCNAKHEFATEQALRIAQKVKNIEKQSDFAKIIVKMLCG